VKLFRIFQEVNDDYDTYDSAIVCAENKESARKIHPSSDSPNNVTETLENNDITCYWCGWKDVKVEYIGKAKEGMKRHCLLASFNSG